VEPSVRDEVEKTIDTIRNALDNYEFKKISDTAIGLAAFGNRYLQSKEPWKLTKTKPNEAKNIIHNCLWISKALAVLIEPLLPTKAEELWKQLGTPRKNTLISEALESLTIGTPIIKPKPLFEQISEETISELSEAVSNRIKEASG
jgi:methionyl-tRNA synthetase